MTKQTCRSRLNDVACQRPYPHTGPHRAEVAPPAPVKGGKPGELEAQVLSWE